MAVEVETQLEAWIAENMPEPGGNPNYTETVTGTLANPWGDIDFAVLHQSVLDGDANASMDIDATALGFGHAYIPMSQFRSTYIDFNGISVAGSGLAVWVALSVGYLLETGVNIGAYLLQGGEITDMSQYATLLPTVLTINHHPLPETE